MALGLTAIEAGQRVLFTTAARPIATLTRALVECLLDGEPKVITTPRLLICDEIGFLAIDRLGALRRRIRGSRHRDGGLRSDAAPRGAAEPA